jgi:pimeloyl-ACP methyl ester carboxylesterase
VPSDYRTQESGCNGNEPVSAHVPRLDYVDVGSGPAVLLVHGTGMSRDFWRLNLPSLARDFRLIVPSLPGCGRSPRLPSRPRDLRPYADALVGLLDELGVPSLMAVGHSLGGLICLRLARDHPLRVSELVLVDSGGAPLSRARLWLITRLLIPAGVLIARPWVMRAVLKRPGLRRRLLAHSVNDPALTDLAVFADALRSFSLPGLIDAVKAGTREQASVTVTDISVPATVIWGRNDRILPLHLGVALAEELPHATLDVLDGSGHAPMVEQPAAFEAALKRAAERSTCRRPTSIRANEP